ncbi:DeoR/GlpR family DNA-binding transcription regulator [Virgibacillus pantothenticus]|uniref:DeoR/GlpR family DNA-binding transcription regulator n=1 Tax=Virgibacillus pantothenticus TaxID=1473 RepID=UPI000986A4E5|nr:DeoR/GlpR family DNA-binding transcription regulator [Virgibacillus pantothenticus]
MLPFERKQIILEELKKGVVYISPLAELLDVSEITVRRDLKFLEEEGRIVRLHGGAAQLVDTSRETPMDQREILYKSEKEDISKYAANLVEDGDVIFIDSGTTNKIMLKYLVNKNISIITNGYKNIEESLNYNLDISLIGGELKKETYAFVGAITSRVLDMYFFDKCFLGANGIDKEFGLTNADPNESLIKEQAIRRSKKAYVLADHTKFSSTSVFKFAEFKETTIITDRLLKDYSEYENIIEVKK